MASTFWYHLEFQEEGLVIKKPLSTKRTLRTFYRALFITRLDAFWRRTFCIYQLSSISFRYLLCFLRSYFFISLHLLSSAKWFPKYAIKKQCLQLSVRAFLRTLWKLKAILSLKLHAKRQQIFYIKDKHTPEKGRLLLGCGGTEKTRGLGGTTKKSASSRLCRLAAKRKPAPSTRLSPFPVSQIVVDTQFLLMNNFLVNEITMFIDVTGYNLQTFRLVLFHCCNALVFSLYVLLCAAFHHSVVSNRRIEL